MQTLFFLNTRREIYHVRIMFLLCILANFQFLIQSEMPTFKIQKMILVFHMD